MIMMFDISMKFYVRMLHRYSTRFIATTLGGHECEIIHLLLTQSRISSVSGDVYQ